jgi:hypothetical protein
MWDPQCLTTLWASMACYRDSFTFLPYYYYYGRHELSSLARTLGSWVRIQLRTWMFGVCMRLFCVCAVLCLGRGLARADHSSKESYRLWKMITELNKRPGPWMDWKSHWKKNILSGVRLSPLGTAATSGLRPHCYRMWQIVETRKFPS